MTFPACRISDTACQGSLWSDEIRWCCPPDSSTLIRGSDASSEFQCLAPAAAERCNGSPTTQSFTGNLYKLCENHVDPCLPEFSIPVFQSPLARTCCADAPPIWVGLEPLIPKAGCATPQTCLSANSAVAVVVTDGGWSDWNNCSSICVNSTQTRSCSHPPRSLYGKPCDGMGWGDYSTEQSRLCGVVSCPVTPNPPEVVGENPAAPESSSSDSSSFSLSATAMTCICGACGLAVIIAVMVWNAYFRKVPSAPYFRSSAPIHPIHITDEQTAQECTDA